MTTDKARTRVTVILIGSAIVLFLGVLWIIPSKRRQLRWKFAEGDTYAYQVLSVQPKGILLERSDYLMRVESVSPEGVASLSLTRTSIALRKEGVSYDSRVGGVPPEDPVLGILLSSIGKKNVLRLTPLGRLHLAEAPIERTRPLESHSGLHLPVIAYLDGQSDGCGFIELPEAYVSSGDRWEVPLVEVSYTGPPATLLRRYSVFDVSESLVSIEAKDEYRTAQHLDLSRETGVVVKHERVMGAAFSSVESRPTSIQVTTTVTIDGQLQNKTEYRLEALSPVSK